MYSVPGVYIQEGVFGATPSPLSRHDSTYIFVTSSIDRTDPYYITSVTDFSNVFGSSLSTKYIKAYFQQNPGVGIWVIQVKPNKTYPITLSTVTPGTTYGITVNGLSYTVVAVTSDTPTTVLDKLATKVNGTSPESYISNSILRITNGTATATGLTLGTLATGATATARDCAAVMMKTFVTDEQLIPGFIVAPEFYEVATATDHSLLAGVAEYSATLLNGMSLVDPRITTALSSDLSLVIAERNALFSPRGHSAYYYPALKDADNTDIMPSVLVAALSIKAQRVSYGTPAAGNQYPLIGITGVSQKIDYTKQAILNPLGINVIRFFSNRGYLVYGARTLSTSAFYTFVTTRVILNVVSRSLTVAFDELVLTGLTYGLAFSVAKSTATSICELMRLNGSLFGSKPDEAYRVIADTTNNTLTTLDQGQLFVDVIVKPTPVTEVIVIRLNRASLAADLTNTELPSAATVATESTIQPQV